MRDAGMHLSEIKDAPQEGSAWLQHPGVPEHAERGRQGLPKVTESWMRSQDTMPSPLAPCLEAELWKIHEFRSGKIMVVPYEDLFSARR